MFKSIMNNKGSTYLMAMMAFIVLTVLLLALFGLFSVNLKSIKEFQKNEEYYYDQEGTMERIVAILSVAAMNASVYSASDPSEFIDYLSADDGNGNTGTGYTFIQTMLQDTSVTLFDQAITDYTLDNAIFTMTLPDSDGDGETIYVKLELNNDLGDDGEVDPITVIQWKKIEISN